MRRLIFTYYLEKIDWVMIGAALGLVAMGLFSLYSSSLAGGDFLNFQKQIIFLAIGLFLLFFFTSFDYRIFKANPYLILGLYFFTLFLLGGLFFLAPEIRGTRSWYKMGPISFDPIELTKIILIILLAKYFTLRHVEMYQLRHIAISGLYILLPVSLIFLQPNLGSVLVVIAVWLGILLVSGIKLRHFLLLMLLFGIIFAFSWIFLLKDYQKARITSFFFPQTEPLGAGWNQRQAKIAIGSGGIFGRGRGEGTQVRYGFLPEAQTDFIFAALAEEIGFLGVSLLFLLFLLLFWRIVRLALGGQSNFSRLFAAGFGISLATEIFINIGMNLGLLPIIGIPLPFVSYGGSALVMNFVGLGILQSILVRGREPL